MRVLIIYAATVLAVLEGVDKGRKCMGRLTVILNTFLLGEGGGATTMVSRASFLTTIGIFHDDVI